MPSHLPAALPAHPRAAVVEAVARGVSRVAVGARWCALRRCECVCVGSWQSSCRVERNEPPLQRLSLQGKALEGGLFCVRMINSGSTLWLCVQLTVLTTHLHCVDGVLHL